MEANLLAVEPTALALGELERGYEDSQPKVDANENRGKKAGVDRSLGGGFPVRPASIALLALAVAQLVWVALLACGAYLAAVWLPL